MGVLHKEGIPFDFTSIFVIKGIDLHPTAYKRSFSLIGKQDFYLRTFLYCHLLVKKTRGASGTPWILCPDYDNYGIRRRNIHRIKLHYLVRAIIFFSTWYYEGSFVGMVLNPRKFTVKWVSTVKLDIDRTP